MASDTGDSWLDAEMANEERRARYVGIWVLALVFGWIEASVIVYLREISIREVALHATSYLPNLQITLASLPGRLVALEMAREACTLVLIAAAGWLAGRRPADRIGAFFTAFGIWDLTYYAVLRLVSGWPDSISTWDILFLIPSPWVAPVWAPVTVATLLVAGGELPVLDRGPRATVSLDGHWRAAHIGLPDPRSISRRVEGRRRSSGPRTFSYLVVLVRRGPRDRLVRARRATCGR